MRSTIRKAFDFVEISEVHPKPRKTGVIEIRGPYYAPTTTGYVKDLLKMWGDYIDGFKFAGGSMRLLSVDMVKNILKVCHDHDVYVSTGGFVERIIVQIKKDEYILYNESDNNIKLIESLQQDIKTNRDNIETMENETIEVMALEEELVNKKNEIKKQVLDIREKFYNKKEEEDIIIKECKENI